MSGPRVKEETVAQYPVSSFSIGSRVYESQSQEVQPPLQLSSHQPLSLPSPTPIPTSPSSFSQHSQTPCVLTAVNKTPLHKDHVEGGPAHFWGFWASHPIYPR